MKLGRRARPELGWPPIFLFALLAALTGSHAAQASTYVAPIPLDDPIYIELETLDGLGLLYTYLPELRPFSRVEAARLTLEAEGNLGQGDQPEPLARSLIADLRAKLAIEIGWIEKNREDGPPTMAALDRIEAEYAYSSGSRRFWMTSNDAGIHAQEAAPLMPDADGMPIGSGSN